MNRNCNNCLFGTVYPPCDGSVDRTNIDKIYFLAKLINADGSMESVYLGIGQQESRGATGPHETMKNTLNDIAPSFYETCVKKMSSFVTDGASINVGEKSGLWKRLDDDRALLEPTLAVPYFLPFRYSTWLVQSVPNSFSEIINFRITPAVFLPDFRSYSYTIRAIRYYFEIERKTHLNVGMCSLSIDWIDPIFVNVALFKQGTNK